MAPGKLPSENSLRVLTSTITVLIVRLLLVENEISNKIDPRDHGHKEYALTNTGYAQEPMRILSVEQFVFESFHSDLDFDKAPKVDRPAGEGNNIC